MARSTTEKKTTTRKRKAPAKGKSVSLVHNTVRVRRTLTLGGEKVYDREVEEHLDTRAFETEPAKVSVGKGITVSLAPYESARVDVHISIPCYLEEVHDVFRALNSWVSREVETEAVALREYREALRTRAANGEQNG